MKLLFAIIQDDDVRPLTRALVEKEISVTRISTTGGFLRGGNSTLMIGVEKDRLQDVLDIIQTKSRRKTVTISSTGAPGGSDSPPLTMPVTVGGATVFVVDVEEFHKF